MTQYEVTFTINTNDTWVYKPGGLISFLGTGVVVPANASITQPFQPGYFYQAPTTVGDPVTATWETTDPGPGWLRVTDPLTTS